jgi:predicted RNase H-like nuclease/ppGpp synthetase/RelA/SpoT-type nucleotidyltranferase
VHFVGVDLAWGENKPTGVAVLDEQGRLVHVSTEQSDDQIVAALGRYVEGDCLVGIDAPLVVKNPTGNRPAEAALNHDFARFEAGAHPANTGKPEFSGTPRGARLSARLGLSLNPRARRARRAIEVYPHPATVVLFGLGCTLKYKNKPGRSFETLRDELLALTSLVEGLAAAEPSLSVGGPDSPWAQLVEAVRGATRKSELRVVEDQVDAVVCAYVALFATRCPDRTTTYGDRDSGAIVTPTLPAELRPTPRRERRAGEPDDGTPAPATAQQVAVQQYAAQQDAVALAGQGYLALVQAILDEAGINYLNVTGRTKSVASFAGKAARRGPDGEPLYADPLREVTDQIGVRVITYVLSDVDAVAELLADQVVVMDDRDMGQETASQGRFGYSSRHLLVGLDPGREAQPAYEALRGRLAAVQVRTVLQHAWAEFEHDIRYKGTVPDEHVGEFDRRFTLAAGLLELADREFSAIRDRLRRGPSEVPDTHDEDPRIDPRELAAFLAGQYPDAGWSRPDHYDWISGLLLELGVTSLQELNDVLRPVVEDDLTARMGYRYPPGAVRRLDDALLAAFGDRYIALHGNAHRAPSLRARLEKLLSPESVESQP